MSQPLVLGSGSPRRLELLAQIGVIPAAIRPPEIDETPHKGERPADYVARMARDKALAVPGDDVILCADTTVTAGRRILGKPADRQEATAFLRLLSGRRHRVTTAVAVRHGDRLWQKSVTTQVRVKPLSADDIAWYLATGDWQGKAGGYGIQGPAARFIPWISGSYTAVVGLPLAETAGLLVAVGVL